MNEQKLQNAMNSTTPEAGDSDVNNILDREKSGKIKEVYHMDKSKKAGAGYSHPYKNMNIETPTETKTNLLWEENKVKKYNLVKDAQDRNLADADGRLIINDKIGPYKILGKLIIMCLVNFPAIHFMLKAGVRPSTKIKVYAGKYTFNVSDLTDLIYSLFEHDIEVLKSSNPSSYLTSLDNKINNNVKRDHQPLDIFEILPKKDKELKQYRISHLVPLMTFEQLERVCGNTSTVPNYTMDEYNEMIESLTKDDTQAPAKTESVKSEKTPVEVKEVVELPLAEYKQMKTSISFVKPLIKTVENLIEEVKSIASVKTETKWAPLEVSRIDSDDIRKIEIALKSMSSGDEATIISIRKAFPIASGE